MSRCVSNVLPDFIALSSISTDGFWSDFKQLLNVTNLYITIKIKRKIVHMYPCSTTCSEIIIWKQCKIHECLLI